MGHVQPGGAGHVGGALVLTALVASSVSAAGSSGPAAADQQVNVLIVNQVALDQTMVRDAQREVGRIFAQIGVDIVWREDVPGEGRLLVVCLTHEPPFAASVSRDALGAAASSPGVRGDRAYVFYPRVVQAVRQYPADLRTVLAMAMAHELGHMLRPTGDHDRDGLMRQTWTPREFALAAKGQLYFSNDAAAQIRETLKK